MGEGGFSGGPRQARPGCKGAAGLGPACLVKYTPFCRIRGFPAASPIPPMTAIGYNGPTACWLLHPFRGSHVALLLRGLIPPRDGNWPTAAGRLRPVIEAAVSITRRIE